MATVAVIVAGITLSQVAVAATVIGLAFTVAGMVTKNKTLGMIGLGFGIAGGVAGLAAASGMFAAQGATAAVTTAAAEAPAVGSMAATSALPVTGETIASTSALANAGTSSVGNATNAVGNAVSKIGLNVNPLAAAAPGTTTIGNLSVPGAAVSAGEFGGSAASTAASAGPSAGGILGTAKLTAPSWITEAANGAKALPSPLGVTPPPTPTPLGAPQATDFGGPWRDDATGVPSKGADLEPVSRSGSKITRRSRRICS